MKSRVTCLAEMLVWSRVSIGRKVNVDMITATIAEWCPGVPSDQIVVEVLKAAVRQQEGVFKDE